MSITVLPARFVVPAALTAASAEIHLQLARRKGGIDFQQTSDLASDLSRDIQRMAYRLHSVKLEILGLTSATARLYKELSQQHHLTIDFSQDGVPPLSRDVSLCLFRVLQEALTNAIRHAGVPHVRVELLDTQTDVQLLVSDDGTRFEPDSASSMRGLGLVSMTEWLNLVGGEIGIESKLGTGTTIRARVPIDSRGGDAVVSTMEPLKGDRED